MLLQGSSLAQTAIIAVGNQSGFINWRDPIINNRGTIVVYGFNGDVSTIFRSAGGGLTPFASAGANFLRVRAVALDDEDKIIFGGETTDDREGIFFGPELPDEDAEFDEKGLPNVLALGGGFFVTDRFGFGTLFRIEESAGQYWSLRLLEDPDTQELVTDPPPQMNKDGVVVFLRRPKGQLQLATLARAQLVPDPEPDREGYFLGERRDLAVLPSRPNALSFSDSGLIALGFGDESVMTISVNGGDLTPINIPNVNLDGSTLAINDEGVIAVTGSYFDPFAGRVDGVLRIEGGAATKIIANGDLVGSDYVLDGIGFGPQGFNNAGQLVFSGSLKSLTNGPSIDAMMITSGGNEPPVESPVEGYHWINENGGSFNSGANWDAGEVPDSADAAFLDLPGSYTVTGGGEVRWLIVGDEPAVNVTLANADISVQSTDPASPGVFIDEGNFTLASGSLNSAVGLVGASAVTRVTIAGGQWDNQALITIGQGGETTMTVREDGHLRSPLLRIGNAHNGAFGTLTLDGGKLDAADLDIGRAGTGTLIVENGGLATVHYNLFALPGPGQGGFFPEVIIGSGPPGSTGRMIVRGEGANTNQSRIIVAGAAGVISSSGATGELLIESGGVAEFWRGLTVGDLRSDARVIVRSLGQLIVTNSGGVADGSLSIAGIGGRAELLVDGGSVESTHAEIGSSLGVSGLGTAVLTNGSFWQIEKGLNVGGSTPQTGLTIAGGQLLIGNPFGVPGEGEDFLETTLRVGSGDELAGTLTITGTSILGMGRNRVEIGRDGFGALVISAGGQFIGGSQLILGESYLDEGARDVLDDGTVVVTGFKADAAPGDPNARSALVMSEEPNDIYLISIADRGEMFVEAGALVQTPYLAISGEAQSQGRLVVTGTGNQLPSTLIAQQLSLGDNSATGYGQLVVSSNAIIAVQTLRVFANAEVNFDTGAILVGPGSSAPAGTVTITVGGRLEGDGRLVHEALEASSTRLTAAAARPRGVFNLGGVVAPGGPSGGLLTIQGNYTQGTNGILEIKLAGLSQHGQLVVTGTAAFEPGAKIRLLLADPNPEDPTDELFVPREGDSFNFLAAPTLTLPAGSNIGDFIEFANAPAGLEVEFDLALIEGETRLTGRTIYSPAGAPRLTAHPAGAGSFVISWPTNLAGFLLESSPALGAGSAWSTVTNTPVITGTDFQVTAPLSDDGRFYRLKN